MKQLGMEEFVVSIEEIDINELKAKFRRLLTNGGRIRTTLAQRIPQLQDRVYYNGRIIEKDCWLLRRKERTRGKLLDFEKRTASD
jgi:hypothetical protein